MDLETQVAAHYSHGALELAILDALRGAGKDLSKLRAEDLSGADEFHTGWRPATLAIGKALGLAAGLRLLDVGSGLGGPARTFAEVFDVDVDGIDLSAEYVEVAAALSRRCGLGSKVSFSHGSALAMPFEDGFFDRATLIHVGMNIAEKGCVFGEVARVLKSGGLFAVYDLMLTSGDVVPYPMPWAVSAATSFLDRPSGYRSALEGAGLAIVEERDMRVFCLDLLRQMREAARQSGAPLLGLHTLVGPAAPERLKNVTDAIEKGVLSPILLVARKA